MKPTLYPWEWPFRDEAGGACQLTNTDVRVTRPLLKDAGGLEGAAGTKAVSQVQIAPTRDRGGEGEAETDEEQIRNGNAKTETKERTIHGSKRKCLDFVIVPNRFCNVRACRTHKLVRARNTHAARRWCPSREGWGCLLPSH